MDDETEMKMVYDKTAGMGKLKDVKDFNVMYPNTLETVPIVKPKDPAYPTMDFGSENIPLSQIPSFVFGQIEKAEREGGNLDYVIQHYVAVLRVTGLFDEGALKEVRSLVGKDRKTVLTEAKKILGSLKPIREARQ